MIARALHQPQESESAEIQELYRLFLLGKTPSLIGPNGQLIPIPESVYEILLQVVGYLTQGKAVSVVPVMQELTTQQAADMIGVSRPFLIGLVNKNEIPHHKTGTHRKIYLKDLLAYRDRRDKERNLVLSGIARRELAEGTYDEISVPDEGE